MSIQLTEPTEEQYAAMLLRLLGLPPVECTSCARAALPEPFCWESYTYTTGDGRSWTWSIGFARKLSAGREPLWLTPEQIAVPLTKHEIVEAHLSHIPEDRLHEPALVAPLPSDGRYVLIDAAHRATRLMRAGESVAVIQLTPIDSELSITATDLAMRYVASELRRRGLLQPMMQQMLQGVEVIVP